MLLCQVPTRILREEDYFITPDIMYAMGYLLSNKDSTRVFCLDPALSNEGDVAWADIRLPDFIPQLICLPVDTMVHPLGISAYRHWELLVVDTAAHKIEVIPSFKRGPGHVSIFCTTKLYACVCECVCLCACVHVCVFVFARVRVNLCMLRAQTCHVLSVFAAYPGEIQNYWAKYSELAAPVATDRVQSTPGHQSANVPNQLCGQWCFCNDVHALASVRYSYRPLASLLSAG